MSIEVNGSSVSVSISGTYTAEQLTQLIDDLGAARAQVASDPAQPVEGVGYKCATEPHLWTRWGPETGGNFLLMTRYPDFGWRGTLMTPTTAAAIGVYIAQYMAYQATITSATGSSSEAAAPKGGSGGNTLH